MQTAHSSTPIRALAVRRPAEGNGEFLHSKRCRQKCRG